MELMATKLQMLRDLGGLHAGKIYRAHYEKVPDGFILVFDDVDEGVLLNMDILIRVNSRN